MLRALSLILILTLFSGCVSFHQGPLPGEPGDATFREVAGTRVRYLDTGGELPPVVLVHGFASSLDVWAQVTPVLAKSHRVIALDLKGFGWTERPPGDYSPAAQADLVFALLDDLGVQRAAVVGHSWGSSVVLAMALRSPSRVERIALYDAWAYEEQLPTAFHWARVPVLGEVFFALFYKERPADKIEMAFYDKSYVTQPFVDSVEENLDRPGTVAGALAAARGQRYLPTQKNYGRITQPVLLLWGADDVVAEVEVGYRLHKQLPNAELVVYEQCGHFPMIEAYHPSTQDLVEFLEVTP